MTDEPFLCCNLRWLPEGHGGVILLGKNGK